METRKFPIKFLVCYLFRLGEPGGSRKFLGVLLVYSSFGPVHFDQSQVLEIDDANLDCNYRAFGELPRFSTICPLPSFRCFVAKFAIKEYHKILSISCRYSVLFPESEFGYFSESSPEMPHRAY